MTRDEILNMPAGREMDALIAEKVLGWQWSGFDGGYQRLYINDGEYRRYGAMREGGETEYTNNLHGYSTDMGAAWEVAEKVAEIYFNCIDGGGLEFVDAGGNVYAANFKNSSYDYFDKYGELEWWECNDGEFGIATANTAPLAVCRAALLAVLEP